MNAEIVSGLVNIGNPHEFTNRKLAEVVNEVVNPTMVSCTHISCLLIIGKGNLTSQGEANSRSGTAVELRARREAPPMVLRNLRSCAVALAFTTLPSSVLL